MTKVFKLVELDCANCAAKMQNAVAELDGVNSVNINFMAQKMTLDADDARFDDILCAAEKAMKKIERDVEIVRG